MNRTKLQNWLLSFALVVAGALLGLVFVGVEIEDPTTSTEGQISLLVINIGIAIVSALLLPWALTHDPREAEGNFDYPGTKRALISSLLVILGGTSYFAVVPCMAAFLSLVARRSVPWIAAAVAAAVGSAVVGTLLEYTLIAEPIDFGLSLLGIVVFLLPALLIGLARGSNREKSLRFQATARNYQRELAARVDEARRLEREHIARDMHDSLSHRLSLIAIHAGALSHENSGLTADKREAAEIIRNQSEAAVDDLRSVLQALRELSPQDPRMGISDLVQEARESGDDIQLDFVGGADADVMTRLSVLAQHTVHRALQEGLTNARKHAPGARVTITVGILQRSRNDFLQVRMRNSKVGRSSSSSSGLGLIGLTERAHLTGGSLNVVNDDEFYWDLELPLEEEVKE